MAYVTSCRNANIFIRLPECKKIVPRNSGDVFNGVAFKPEAEAEAVKKVCSGVLALKDSCLTADTKTPYIKSITGGINSSPEGFTNGYTYDFVVEFDSAEDRDYYVKQDTAHRSLVDGALPYIQQLCIVDYTPGVF